ncbi:hypothetical protein DPMN_135548 [Dreissena polymorpha]|uniref:Uncharacterized protein n=1 Tax=Dreissena polymorpha TaxID=45954 RepID=A0A9D4JFX2_DREPO|nr:hypothetical protein DPMN_135548 [Dreissena polymorpha]
MDGVEYGFDQVEFPSKTYNFIKLDVRMSLQQTHWFSLIASLTHCMTRRKTRLEQSLMRTYRGQLVPVSLPPCDTGLVSRSPKHFIIHVTLEGDILDTYSMDIRHPWRLCLGSIIPNALSTHVKQLNGCIFPIVFNVTGIVSSVASLVVLRKRLALGLLLAIEPGIHFESKHRDVPS